MWCLNLSLKGGVSEQKSNGCLSLKREGVKFYKDIKSTKGKGGKGNGDLGS